MFFESIAYGMSSIQGSNAEGGNPWLSFAPLILMFVIFYFLLIRPQQKKAKQHRELLTNLKVGDSVLTGGGLYGKIVALSGDVITLDLGDDMKVKINRAFISGLSDTASDGKKGA